MDADTHLFFTKCHWLYMQGMRRAMRERLQSAYGADWWGRGVLPALTEAARQRLQDDVARYPGQEPHLLLDAGHFARIVTRHHNAAFADAFRDGQRAAQNFWQLALARNQWAHIQSISPAQAGQAADLMRQMLAALRCEEALEIAEMMQRGNYEPDSAAADEWRLPEPEPLADQANRAEPETDLWRIWNQAQSYLTLGKSVILSSNVRNREMQAAVQVRVQNTAPDSKDWPIVHFKSVSLDIPGIAWELERNRRQGPKSLGALGPGEVRDVEIIFPAKQLIAVEFVVFGEVDADRLFQFRQTSNLPGDVVGPLQREFVDRLAAIGINEFVKRALDAFEAISPDMTLADVIRMRQSFGQLAESIAERRGLLDALVREFHLGQETALGQRARELVLALVDFNAKVSELDTAIGNTDLALISHAVGELKQIQISVLRVEDTIRAMNDGEQAR